MAANRLSVRLASANLSPEQLCAFIDELAPLLSDAALRVAAKRNLRHPSMFQHMRRSLVASSARLARYTTKADATRLEAARSASLADRSALAAELSGRWIVATGDPQQTESAGDSFGFALRVDEVNLGVLRAALFPAPPKQRRDEGHLRTALIFGASCHPGLPLSLAAKPLVEVAAEPAQPTSTAV